MKILVTETQAPATSTSWFTELTQLEPTATRLPSLPGHVRMGTPHFRDPGSLYLYEIGDPGPYLHIVLGIPDP